jgi:radical SAM additional 4Fe4S-binding domain
MYGDVKMTHKLVDLIAEKCSEYADNVTWIWHGGEPTLMGTEWYKVAQDSFYKNFTTMFTQHMQSNGLLLNDEWAQLCSDYGIEVGVSYDAFSQDVRLKASSLRVEQGILAFKKRGLNIGVITVINEVNYREQIQMYEYFRDVLKTNVSFNHIYRTAGSLANGLEPDINEFNNEYAKFLKYWLFDTRGVSERSALDSIKQVMTGEGACCTTRDCRKDWISINSVGAIYPCDRHVPECYRVGNIQECQSIEIVYNAQGYKLYHRDVEKRFATHCRQCGYLELCGGLCNANHIAVAGSADGIDDNSCNIFKGRYNEAYRLLREIDVYKQIFNPIFAQELIQGSFISVREIKNALDARGLRSDLEYVGTERGLLHCREYKLFRVFNPVMKSIGGHTDIIKPMLKINCNLNGTFDFNTIKEQRLELITNIFAVKKHEILSVLSGSCDCSDEYQEIV